MVRRGFIEKDSCVLGIVLYVRYVYLADISVKIVNRVTALRPVSLSD